MISNSPRALSKTSPDSESGWSISARNRRANARALAWQSLSVSSMRGSSWDANRSLKFQRTPWALLVAIANEVLSKIQIFRLTGGGLTLHRQFSVLNLFAGAVELRPVERYSTKTSAI